MSSSPHPGNPPVVIAGAGPVGLTLALALARAGVRSLILEKKAELDPRSRATLIVPRSLQLFEELGVLSAFLAKGQRNPSLRILRASDRKRLLQFDFDAVAGRTTTPYALAISQDITERILLDAVLQTAAVEVAFGAALEGFTATRDGVIARATDNRVIKAQFLVGADGAHSTVREQLGLRLEGKTYPTRAALADVRVDPARDTLSGWLADPKATSFTIAIRFADGVWRIIEAAVPDDLGDEELDARARTNTEALFGRGAWRETLWTAAYRKHERRAERFVDGRVILAGDAAHLNSPAGGQGMNVGLADADRLAKALVEALSPLADATSALAAYERERQVAFDRDVRGLTDALERMESAPSWARSFGISMIGLAKVAGLEQRVARRLSMLEPT